MEQNPQLQELMQGDPSAAPMGAPMSTDIPRDGVNAEARSMVTNAMAMLEQALIKMGSHTEEGRTVMDVLDKLSKNFHKDDNKELSRSQLMAMWNQNPQVGGGTPEQLALMRQTMQPQGGQPPQQPMGASPSM